MGLKNGIGKINFREIARGLNISVMTLYRVLNNEPSVSPETRARVTEALNRYGYYTHKPAREIRIIFDFCDHVYLQHYGMQLMQRLSHHDYSCIATDHRKNPRKFLDAAAESDIAVYCSVPDNRIIQEAKKNNPDIYQISVYTKCDADIVISSDNNLGGELAAEHLYSMGHRHIAVYLSESHPTRFDRYHSFFAKMKSLDPACRIDCIHEKRGETLPDVCSQYFKTVHPMPTAIFFLTGGSAQTFYLVFLRERQEEFKDLSIMSYDHPENVAQDPEILEKFDRIEFLPQDILDWTEFYIINRPMMKNRTTVHTGIKPYLKIAGSVKKRNGISEISDHQRAGEPE